MAGYTRQSSSDIVSGEIVEAAPLNAEFNQIQSAFDETTGHSHDGTAGEGPTIPLITDADADTKIHTETSADEDIIRITIAGTELLQIGANSLRKATGSTVGLGSTTNRFDASFVSSLTTSAATVDVLLVTTGGTANFSGNVLNNVGTSATVTDAANVGYVNAKITSANLTGVTTNALVVGSGGTTDFNSVRLSEVGTPTVATDAATKGYTDDAIAGQLGGLAGPVSTTDNGLVLWDGTVGGAVQNSPWTLDPTTGVMTPGGTDPSITDLVVSDTATFEGLMTTTFAGEYAEENYANATGDVTISATDPTVLRRTLTGDVTLLVAGAETPGYGWSTELRTVQDGTGGWDVTILPANMLVNTATLSTQSVTVTAAAHTLSFYGTGTVTLSGVSTAGPLVGTGAGDRVTLTFTPTSGSLTLTVSGTVSTAQLVLGSAPLGYGAVGATRAGMVTWRTAADEIDYAAQAAAAASRIIIGVGSDGEILIDDVSLEA
jgi:hypothetical protein